MRVGVAAAALLIGSMVASMREGSAQTWHWTYVSHAANNSLPPAESSVAISANAMHLTYTMPTRTGTIVIESCRADLRDVVDAAAIEANGTKFLLVRFKSGHSAACVSGRRPAVALPADDEREVKRVASAIDRSCCQTPRAAAVAASPVAVAPTVSPTPVATLPTSSPLALAARDWVESDGLFWFVRIHNDGAVALTVHVKLSDCRKVACQDPAPIRVAPGKTGTAASVATPDGNAKASFSYRYEAGAGSQSIAGFGSAEKTVPPDAERMTESDLRAAQAAALAELRGAAPVTPVAVPADAETARDVPVTEDPRARPARLLARGSSRLAIGQTGTATVRVIVGPNGTAVQATIVSTSNANLTAAAIETAVSSRYAPAVRNGTPIAAKYIATFSFDGEDPSLAGIPVWKRGVPPPSATTMPTALEGNAIAVPSSMPSPGATSPSPEPVATPTPSPSPEPVASPGAPASPGAHH